MPITKENKFLISIWDDKGNLLAVCNRFQVIENRYGWKMTACGLFNLKDESLNIMRNCFESKIKVKMKTIDSEKKKNISTGICHIREFKETICYTDLMQWEGEFTGVGNLER